MEGNQKMELQSQDKALENLERGVEIEDGETLEDNKEKLSPPQQVPSLEEPPDGGWGWVMVVGAGMALSIITGFNKSVALLYQEMLVRFRQSAAATASATSMNGTIRMVLSPLVSIMINHTSHRTVGILAGLTCSIGTILTAFMPSLPLVYLTYGFIEGFGVAMYIVSDLSMVNLYFSKNRGKANALRSCFLGVGALYMTQLMSSLLENYGYHGALLIVGGLMLHLIPGAALFRPLTEKPKRLPMIQTEEEVQETKPLTVTNGDKAEASSRSHDNTGNGYLETSKEASADGHGQVDGHIIVKEPQTSKCDWLSTLLRGVKTVASSFGFSALKHHGFCICAVLMSSFSIVNSLNMSLLAGMALEKGYRKDQVPLVMTLNFATEIPCRLLSGVLFDLPCIRNRRLLVWLWMSLMFGGLVASQPFVPVLIPSAAFWMMQSGLMGGFQAQSSTVMSDSVPRSTITSSVGLLRMIQGFGNLVGPFVGGLIRDLTGSYSYGFVFAGVQICVLSVVGMIITLCWPRTQQDGS